MSPWSTDLYWDFLAEYPMSLQRENQMFFATNPYLSGLLNIDRHFCVLSILAVWNGAEACFMNHLPFAQEAGRTGFPDLRDHLMVIPPRPQACFKYCNKEQYL